MYDLSKIEDVKNIQSQLRIVFDSPSGKEVVSFLEQLCGWYDFKSMETNDVLIHHGGRRILATIKTLIRLPAEQIVALSQKEM